MVLSLARRLLQTNNPPKVEKTGTPLRFGILGASRIAPNSIIKPVRCHEDTFALAVAARSKERAQEFARQWDIPKVYGGANGYQELLDDAEIDAVYIGLPNGLHYEWTIKALLAGKHVLCDKPIASNEEETRKMFSLAEEKGLVLLEAWQPRFHPALHRVKEIIDEGSLGKIVKMYSQLGIWGNVMFPKDDIRYNYQLSGGALMDLGPYPLNAMRYVSSSEPAVQSAKSICRSENVDRRTEAELLFGESSIPATLIVDLSLEGWGPFKLLPQWVKLNLKVECEKGSVEIWNFILPSLLHSITVTQDGKTRVEKVYKPQEGKGEVWWSAYRYELEAFVDKIRGRNPQAWRTAEDSICAMHAIDEMYTKSGLALRPTSQYSP